MLLNVKIGEIVCLKDEDGNDIEAKVLGVEVCYGWEFVIVEDHIHGTDGFIAHLYVTGYPIRSVVFPSIEKAKSRLPELVSNKGLNSIDDHIERCQDRMISGWVPNVKGDALRPIMTLKRPVEGGCKIIYFNETPKGYSVVVMQFAQGAKKKLFSKHFSQANALRLYHDGLSEGYRDHYRAV